MSIPQWRDLGEAIGAAIAQGILDSRDRIVAAADAVAPRGSTSGPTEPTRQQRRAQ